MDEIHYRNVDWNEVIERVTLAAVRQFICLGLGRGRLSVALGRSPGEFALDAVIALWDGKKVKWNSSREATTASVTSLLRVVATRDIIDTSRRVGCVPMRPLVVDGEAAGSDALMVDGGISVPDEVIGTIERDRLWDLLLDAAKGKPKLEEYIILQASSDEPYGYPPEEAARLLSTTASDIYNRKKQCARLHRLFEPQEPHTSRAIPPPPEERPSGP